MARPIARLLPLGFRGRPNKANYVPHPGEMFNTLNKPAKPSGRRQGLRSTGSGLACSTFLLFFDSWPLMRRPGDVTVTFLVLGSCECWVTIFRVAGGRGGCGGVSSSTLAVGAAGSASIASRTYPVSSLSASVNVSCGTPETTVVWSRYVSTCGGRDAAVPALATIAASSTTMSRWLSHPSVYSVAGLWLKNEFETTSARPSWSTGRI